MTEWTFEYCDCEKPLEYKETPASDGMCGKCRKVLRRMTEEQDKKPDTATFYEMCKDCKYYWERKGQCSVFEKDAGPTERSLRIYRAHPPECSTHEYSSSSNWQFLRAIHYSFRVSIIDALKGDSHKRLANLAGKTTINSFTNEELLIMALEAQDINQDDF